MSLSLKSTCYRGRLLSELLTPIPTLNVSSPQALPLFPSFPFLCISPFWLCAILVLVAFLAFFCLPLVSSSLALPFSLLSWPHEFCWPCSVWTLPDAFGCARPHIYSKTFFSARPRSGPPFISFRHQMAKVEDMATLSCG